MTHLTMCASALTQPLTLSKEFRILPAGRFKAVDGRPGQDQYWNLSEATGQRLVAEAVSRNQDYLIDYEHQSLSGQQSPAAGWFNTLAWKPDGLYVQAAEWTAAAKAMIVTNEYRFISPVFTYTKDTYEVQSLVSIALTNTPALPQLTDLSSVALTQENLLQVASLTDKDILNLARMTGKTVPEFTAALSNGTLNPPKSEDKKPKIKTEMQGRSLEVFQQNFPEMFS
ncbi:phage protease [Undibacterium sp. Ji49W]|uniref:phage protease n=1 Tax=Undibacterium sp. Ji49W TaxID=3413040 RepID=UPI003BF39555